MLEDLSGAEGAAAAMAERGARCNRQEDSMIGMAGRQPGSREESSRTAGWPRPTMVGWGLAESSRTAEAGGGALKRASGDI
jgi:hypothetical protein